MERENFVLAALSAGETDPYDPVQVQKLFFLLDKKLTDRIGGPYFNFIPDAYGPYDKEVYTVLRDLEKKNLVAVQEHGFHLSISFRLTSAGFRQGTKEFEKLPEKYRNYLVELVAWMRGLNFTELVSTIYANYPEMSVNAVFRE